MLFSEIYGSYYNAVARILSLAVDGTLDKKKLNTIVCDTAFGESLMTIPDALRSGTWGLLTSDLETPLETAPSMPLTLLQKRWMKAILLDKRIQLFSPDTSGLERIEPLFRPEQIVYFDRSTDGDDYSDREYIRNFRTILEALKTKKQLDVTFSDRLGNNRHCFISPKYLEYSEKDDRFRLVCESYRPLTINLSRLNQCTLTEKAAISTGQELRHDKSLTMLLTDERNALERVLLCFSHLEKETVRLDDSRYRITLHYDANDETEILIRILSFGAMVQVISPESFMEKLRERLGRQKKYTG